MGERGRRTCEAARKTIDTREEYHNAAFAFDSYEARYPLYLLGIEKPRARSARPYCAAGDDHCAAPAFDARRFRGSSDDDPDAIDATRSDIRDRLFGDPRSLVLTHVLRAAQGSSGGGPARGACFVYNVYSDETSVPWCGHRHVVDLDTEEWTREGWTALDRLRRNVTEAASQEKPTHILLLATGWNTDQHESFLDFSCWLEGLEQDFRRQGETFRPIVIAVSWESAWRRSDAASFPTKGNDADEIGFTWANYLLNDVLHPVALASGAQLVAIGHSFGSRIVFGAHYARDVLVRSPAEDVAAAPLTLIGMQAAFPTGRFISRHGREHPYVAANKAAAVVVVTSSEHDAATGLIQVGTGYVGGPGGLDELRTRRCSYEKSVVARSATGDGSLASAPDPATVSVYDASAFVSCELPGTSSGAHSDVYDREMGHFLGEVIRAGDRR